MYKLTKFFKVLSDETRLRIMVLLYHKNLCVCQICGVTGISQPNISKHLAKLRDMGLVNDERKDLYTFYSLNLQDKLYMNILEDIIKNIDEFPTLKSDVEESKKAERFIELMKSKEERNLDK